MLRVQVVAVQCLGQGIANNVKEAPSLPFVSDLVVGEEEHDSFIFLTRPVREA